MFSLKNIQHKNYSAQNFSLVSSAGHSDDHGDDDGVGVDAPAVAHCAPV